MENGAYTLSEYWRLLGYHSPQVYHPVHHDSMYSPLKLRTLYVEQDILENNLADCVTYLQVLRKKQDRNEDRSSTNSSTTRKKRKQIQQSKRELTREILVREQEQSILLHNLKACRVQICVAEASSSFRCIRSSAPALTLGSTQDSIPDRSGPAQISWQGWTDDAAMSPFAKRSDKPFFINEIAPNEYGINQAVEQAISHNPSSVIQMGSSISIPTTATTSSLHALPSLLRPKAKIFEPRTTICAHGYARQHPRQSRDTQPQDLQDFIEEKGHQLSDYSMNPSHQGHVLPLKPASGNVRSHTWCYNTPQVSPSKDFRGQRITRTRTNSM